VLENIHILWKKYSTKRYVLNGGQQPRGRHLKKNLAKFELEHHLAGFLETTF
jgi:hypothetical protein